MTETETIPALQTTPLSDVEVQAYRSAPAPDSAPPADLDSLFAQVRSHLNGLASEGQVLHQAVGRVGHQGGAAFNARELVKLMRHLSDETGEALRRVREAASVARRAIQAQSAVASKQREAALEIGMSEIIGVDRS